MLVSVSLAAARNDLVGQLHRALLRKRLRAALASFTRTVFDAPAASRNEALPALRRPSFNVTVPLTEKPLGLVSCTGARPLAAVTVRDARESFLGRGHVPCAEELVGQRSWVSSP